MQKCQYKNFTRSVDLMKDNESNEISDYKFVACITRLLELYVGFCYSRFSSSNLITTIALI